MEPLRKTYKGQFGVVVLHASALIRVASCFRSMSFGGP